MWQTISMKSLTLDAIYGVCLSFGAKLCLTYSLPSRQPRPTIHQAPEPTLASLITKHGASIQNGNK